MHSLRFGNKGSSSSISEVERPLHHHYKVTRFYFYHTSGNHIIIIIIIIIIIMAWAGIAQTV
jgi:hypothetical protein